jgi:hypothetical protein
MKSRNFKNNFRKVDFENNSYLVWLNYDKFLFKEGKCIINAELISNKIELNSSKNIDIPFDGSREVKRNLFFL